VVDPLVLLDEDGPGVCFSSTWGSGVAIVDLLTRSDEARAAFLVGMVDKVDLLVETRVETALLGRGGDTSADTRVTGGCQPGGTDRLADAPTPGTSAGA